MKRMPPSSGVGGVEAVHGRGLRIVSNVASIPCQIKIMKSNGHSFVRKRRTLVRHPKQEASIDVHVSDSRKRAPGKAARQPVSRARSERDPAKVTEEAVLATCESDTKQQGWQQKTGSGFLPLENRVSDFPPGATLAPRGRGSKHTSMHHT